MIIKNISLFYLKIKKFHSSYPRPSFYKNGIVFLKLECDENLSGYGEISPYIADKKEIFKYCEKISNTYFKNKRVNLNYVYYLKIKNYDFIFQSLLSAYDQAIHDLYAKRKKISVAKYLGFKKSKSLNFYASGGMIFENQSYNKILDEAIKAKEDGYFGYKFRPKMPKENLNHFQRMKNPPKINVKELEKFSEILRLKLGENFKIMIDLGCRLKNSKETKYLFKMFSEHNYYFVEEPFQRKPLLYLNQKKNLSKVKISGGEHIFNLKEFNKWSKTKLFDFFQPDTNLLLYREMSKIINIVGSKNIILHNWCSKINFISNISFAFSLNKNLLVEKNILKNPYDKFFVSGLGKIKSGKILLPKSFGFGISFKKKIDSNYIIYEKKI